MQISDLGAVCSKGPSATVTRLIFKFDPGFRRARPPVCSAPNNQSTGLWVPEKSSTQRRKTPKERVFGVRRRIFIHDTKFELEAHSVVRIAIRAARFEEQTHSFPTVRRT